MIYLASTSPRRRALLHQVGLDFRVHEMYVDETPQVNETATRYVARLALLKASTALEERYDGDIVIAADTTVSVNGGILQKPVDFEDAVRIWTTIGGRTHQVITGIAVANHDQILHRVVITDVTFNYMSEQQMIDYWETGEPQDKAGAYAIQGFAAAFIPAVKGSYSNVVGLPICETLKLLNQLQSGAPTGGFSQSSPNFGVEH